MTLKIFTVLLVHVFVVSVIAIHNKYCQLSCDYVIKTFTHTVCDRQKTKCGFDKKCGPRPKIVNFSDGHRQYILDLHNYYRNYVALGSETRGRQPPAANMNILNYNMELEFIAQCWANSCSGNPLVHDNCRRTGQYEHVGQNLGFINSSLPIKDIYKPTKELIQLWYNEVRLFKNEWVNETLDRGPNFKVGHYTQMLWADTKEIGCAATFYTSSSSNKTWNHMVFVCNYGPGGNYLGLPVYQIGKPSSACAENMKPNQHYTGLCGVSKRVAQDNKIQDFLYEFN